MRSGHRGFTLIELVIVITIIGILAATALPRYVAMQADARIAKAYAIMGAIRSASALAHSRCLLDLGNAVGTCTAAGGTANMEGTLVTMVNQFPTADAAGIIAAAQITPAADGLTITGGGSGASTSLYLEIVGGTSPNCRVTYTTGAAPVGGVVNSPVTSVVTSGC